MPSAAFIDFEKFIYMHLQFDIEYKIKLWPLSPNTLVSLNGLQDNRI